MNQIFWDIVAVSILLVSGIIFSYLCGIEQLARSKKPYRVLLMVPVFVMAVQTVYFWASWLLPIEGSGSWILWDKPIIETSQDAQQKTSGSMVSKPPFAARASLEPW